MNTQSYEESQTNNSSRVCPITLNSKSQILKDGRSCFEIRNEQGVLQQIYNANALADWLMINPEYPHKGVPSQSDITRLQELIPEFKYLRDKHSKSQDFVSEVYNDFSGEPVSHFHGIENIHNVKQRLYDLLLNSYGDSIADLQIWYKNKTHKLGLSSALRVSIIKRVSLLSRIDYILLKDIYVSDSDELSVFFEVGALRSKKRVSHCIVHMVNISDMDSLYGIYYSEASVQHEIRRRVSINNTINLDKHIYHSEDGEYVYRKDDPNGFQLSIQSAGSSMKKYKGRNYKIRTGRQGGKYIIVKGEKKYITKPTLQRH